MSKTLHPRALAQKAADAGLEATIVGSFTKVGYGVRGRMFGWTDDWPSMAGQQVIVTGATSGIGRATAAGLLQLGADVHVTSRSQDRADQAAAELNLADDLAEHRVAEPHAGGRRAGTATGYSLDTGNFQSVRAFAAKMADLDGGIDVLINNAGALTDAYNTDERGTELTLSTHLIGPYLLVKEVRPHLNPGARVLWMSSGGMYTQRLDVDRIEMSEGSYRGAIAYARAKRGQVEMVALLGPDWAPEVIMHAVHPGWVDTPGVDAGLPGFGKVMGPLLRDADQGADTMIWLAATGGGDVEPGQFWHDREPRRTVYVPGTRTNDAERQKLIDWLEQHTGPASESA